MNPTGIEYLDYTWNVTHGCTPVSPGCAHCWAKATAETRLRGRCGYPQDKPFSVVCDEQRLDEPLKLKKPSRIGVSFMGDLFHSDVPFEFIDKVFARMAVADWHTYMVLTKRAERMEAYMCTPYHIGIANEIDRLMGTPFGHLKVQSKGRWPLPNVWAGVSVESQDYAWRLDHLAKVPAAVRWLSAEPLLDNLNVRKWLGFICGHEVVDGNTERCEICSETEKPLGLVICGGESGPRARPMHPDWARNLRDQCKAAGVPFFFKQWGAFAPRDVIVVQRPDYDPENEVEMARVGKKAAGALLDGVRHQEVPR